MSVTQCRMQRLESRVPYVMSPWHLRKQFPPLNSPPFLPLPLFHCCCRHFDPCTRPQLHQCCSSPHHVLFAVIIIPPHLSPRSRPPSFLPLSSTPSLSLGTPPAPQSGEERFAVVLDAQDDVWLEVLSVSRPANVLSLLLLPLARHQQRAFARGATARLRALTQQQRTEESGKDD